MSEITYRTAGIPVSAGTDSPVIPYNPFWVLYHFITRETISAAAMGVDQRLDRLDALRLSTVDYAFLTFAEGRKGTIETGKLADLVILNHDILGVPDDMVRDLGPVMTIVDGTVVYDARN